VEVLLASLDHPAPSSAGDDGQFEAGHKDSLLRQLNRQARLSVDLARRCAAQSAQISVLASAAQNFLRPGLSIENLLSEILAHYLAVIGSSRRALSLFGTDGGLPFFVHLRSFNVVHALLLEQLVVAATL